jgi:hypothetical protein
MRYDKICGELKQLNCVWIVQRSLIEHMSDYYDYQEIFKKTYFNTQSLYEDLLVLYYYES